MTLQSGMVFALLLALTGGAMGQTTGEYPLKAAFLYNLAKFVEWPAGSFKDPGDPFVVCVVGQTPITGELELAVKGATLAGRSFLILRISDVRQANHCQIVFVSSSERNRFRAILLELRGHGILTVGEADTFVAEGGTVNFKLDQGRIRLQINTDAAAYERLQISSRLLILAQIVKNATAITPSKTPRTGPAPLPAR